MKNNNRKKDWKSTLIWTIIIGFILTVLVLSIRKKANSDISKVNIVIKSMHDQRPMISKREIKQKFRNHLGYDISRGKIKDLDIRAMEGILYKDERISRAEIFIDNNNVINIFIAQKDPILRIMNKDQQSYYLDENGHKVPVEYGPAIRVPIATGYIENFDLKLLAANSPSRLRQVFDIAKYVQQDAFLNALIEQVDVDKEGNITIVPKIGNQKLSMGRGENIDKQFDRLKTLYRNGLPKIGWRKHSVYRLDLEGQITGVRRE